MSVGESEATVLGDFPHVLREACDHLVGDQGGYACYRVTHSGFMLDQAFEEVLIRLVRVKGIQILVEQHRQQLSEFVRHVVQCFACGGGLLALQKSGEQGLSV